MCDIKNASVRYMSTTTQIPQRKQKSIGYWCMDHGFLMKSRHNTECIIGYSERIKAEGKTIEDKAEIEADMNAKRLTL